MVNNIISLPNTCRNRIISTELCISIYIFEYVPTFIILGNPVYNISDDDYRHFKIPIVSCKNGLRNKNVNMSYNPAGLTLNQ